MQSQSGHRALSLMTMSSVMHQVDLMSAVCGAMYFHGSMVFLFEIFILMS